MNIETIKILAALFSILGSSLLAIRVVGILSALSLVANCHETNIDNLFARGDGTTYHLGNSTKHVEKAKKKGLLIFGFICIILSAVLQLVALVMANRE